MDTFTRSIYSLLPPPAPLLTRYFLPSLLTSSVLVHPAMLSRMSYSARSERMTCRTPGAPLIDMP